MRALPRRPVVEQKIIALLRQAAAGEQRAPDPPIRHGQAVMSAADWQLFARLTDGAWARGLHIRAPDAPFVHEDELRILAWLAIAQRLVGVPAALAGDDAFFDLVLSCARRMGAISLKLPHRSMLNAEG